MAEWRRWSRDEGSPRPAVRRAHAERRRPVSPAPARGVPPPAAASARPGDGFRADIQGLRAIAVLLVLAFHLWPKVVTGGFVGVDSFFVISGFLITSHLLTHPPRRGADLLAFWGRRIRRLLPAAFLVLIATAIASRLVAPDTRWAAIAGETIASALYVQNWALAANAVDYLGAAEAPTPVQHYWSLSVEEQFYLVWPVLILGVFWLAARVRRDPRGATRLAMLAVVAASLAASVVLTDQDPASAYFITPTRVWELAAGGLVATLPSLASLRLPPRLVSGVAWAGIAAVLVAGFTFDEATLFPGSAAILPVGGTALAILAAAQGPGSPTRWLGVRPMQHLGDTSYSIYLWHWPLIVLWPYAFGPIGPFAAAVIVALTIGLASASKLHVEDRFRFAPSLQPLVPTFRLAGVGMLVVCLLGGTQLLEAQARLDAAMASGPGPGADTGDGEPGPVATLAPGASAATPAPTVALPDPSQAAGSCIGAAAIVAGFDACPQDPAGAMKPDPVAARHDLSAAYGDGCWIYTPFDATTTCTYGKGPVKIALVGNSHAGHWLPALQVLAKLHGWTITTFLASRCNATDATLELYGGTQGCLAYGRWVLSRTSGTKFDLVITSERQSVRTHGDTWAETAATAQAGYASYLAKWSAAGTKVLVLRDTPYPGNTVGSIPDCLAIHRTDQGTCSGTPEAWAWMDPLYDAARQAPLPGIETLSTQRFFCTPAVCPGVIGGIVAYFDASHMTATYSRSLAPFLEGPILEALAGTDPDGPAQ